MTQEVNYGLKGSIRLDVFEQATGKVWDYKFTPVPSLSPSRIKQITDNAPGVTFITPVGP